MKRIAEIVVNIQVKSINKPFSYIIPDCFNYVNAGWRVVVPFGNQKIEGFILSVKESVSADGLKEILDVLDDEAWFDANMFKLAEWISQYYLCNLADALRLFIPGKSGVKSMNSYSVMSMDRMLALKDEHKEVLLYIYQQGNAGSEALKKKFGCNVHKILRSLEEKQAIMRQVMVKKAASPLYKKQICLAVSPETAEKFIADHKKKKPAQSRILEELVQHNLSAEHLKDAGIHMDGVNKLLEQGLVRIELERVMRDSYDTIKESQQQMTLSAQQASAVEKVKEKIGKKIFHSFLLHGITGSGKTQVYIEAVVNARELNRQAIILVPEIALTGQIVSRFKARFGEDVVVLHSKLSAGERFDAWQRLRGGHAGIVIGARSAIFAPLSDVGIIIMDEEHEFTYKQEETPRYHTREVALKKAALANAVVILGSATPAIETYYQALQGKHAILSMDQRIDSRPLPEICTIDMRQELKQGRRSVLSLSLQNLLRVTMARGEQAIILLNRRGYATFVMCRECGHIIKCKSCDISMVYHAAGNKLRCHYCQREEPSPDICPACRSRYIRYFGSGTQKLEEELNKYLPEARIIRMDQDTTGGKMAHDRILKAFAQKEYDVLLGTQMVAKGHDIQNVTAVGIIAADSILNLPDFRASERVFSLITQAAGRAGRGEKPGQVVVQTYNPEHYAVKFGSGQDYEAFYRAEIEGRKELRYPPFSQIIKINIQADNSKEVQERGLEVAAALRKQLAECQDTEIIGPFWTTIAKVKDVFRMNIIIKTISLDEVRAAIARLNFEKCADVYIDVEPVSLL